jgi:hypothetical protein
MASAIPAEKRTRTVAVRLTPGEESAWIAAALAAGRRQLGAWVREVAVAGYLAGPRTTNPREVDPAVAGLRAELARLGNNVNQIAHALNTPATPTPTRRWRRRSRIWRRSPRHWRSCTGRSNAPKPGPVSA